MFKKRSSWFALLAVAGILVFGAREIIGRSISGRPGIKRVVFVTIDTLRADHLGTYGYPRDVSPFIDSLAQNGALFTRAFTAAPHTAPSHATMFTGLFPFQHNLLKNQETLNPAVYNIAKWSTEIGLNPLAFPSVKFLEGRVGFPFIEGVTNADDGNFKKFWYRNASNVVDNAISALKKTEKHPEVFLWLHFYDVHQWAGRRNIPKEYFSKVKSFPQSEHIEYLIKYHNTPVSFFGSEEKTLAAINGYDARLMYVDDELRRFSEYLKSVGLDRDTLWVITSDHGEGLGNHNYKGHGQFLYHEQLHIPLIFYIEGGIKPMVIDELVRTVDLFPTIAELLGRPLSAKHKIEGISLKPLLTGEDWSADKIRHSFAERRPKDMISFRREWEEGEIYSLHNLAGKYVEHSLGVDEYYDLRADPFELKNLAPDNDQIGAELKSALQEIFDESKRRGAEEDLELHSPEELEELKTLGYL